MPKMSIKCQDSPWCQEYHWVSVSMVQGVTKRGARIVDGARGCNWLALCH
jgi:hypothetical protein